MEASGVTVIVCCYNSESRIGETLKHIWGQELDSVTEQQLIVVDNNCTDDTVLVARCSHAASGGRWGLQIVNEERPGLIFARLAGMSHAKYETVVFCDDDNSLMAMYCQKAFNLLRSHSDVGLAGGDSVGVFESEPPDWFFKLSGAWAVGSSDYCGYLPQPYAMLRGAGMIVRRSAFRRLIESGFEFLATGRAGASLASGEDSELCRGIELLRYKLFYDSALRLNHHIPAGRLTRNYALRLFEGFGAGTIATDAERIASRPNEIFRNRIRVSFYYQLIRGFWNLLCAGCEHPLLHRKDPSGALRYCSLRGRLKAIWRLGGEYQAVIEKRVKWLRCLSINALN